MHALAAKSAIRVEEVYPRNMPSSEDLKQVATSVCTPEIEVRVDGTV